MWHHYSVRRTCTCAKDTAISKKQQQMLWQVVKKSREKLSESERNQLYRLFAAYADVFSCSDDELGHTGRLKHVIDPGNHPLSAVHQQLCSHR